MRLVQGMPPAEAATEVALLDKKTAVASAQAERQTALEACEAAMVQARKANKRAATAEEAATTARLDQEIAIATASAEAAEAQQRAEAAHVSVFTTGRCTWSSSLSMNCSR